MILALLDNHLIAAQKRKKTRNMSKPEYMYLPESIYL